MTQAAGGDTSSAEHAPYLPFAGGQFRLAMGLMPLPEGMPKPFWLGYVGVADADAAIDKAQKASATVHRMMDIPTISSAEYPKIFSAPLFQLVIMPLRSLPIMASSENSTMAASRREAGSGP